MPVYNLSFLTLVLGTVQARRVDIKSLRAIRSDHRIGERARSKLSRHRGRGRKNVGEREREEGREGQ